MKAYFGYREFVTKKTARIDQNGPRISICPMTESLRLPEFALTKTTLGNGLDVIFRRQGQLPIVAVNLWYHVGSKDEEHRQRGFAHLFEHLMFEGSAHYPGTFFKPLQRLGASINGSTSTDRTNYFVDVPAAHLELVLAMESDRMGYLVPALDESKLRIQKDVVKNEYRQNYTNRPYGMVWQHLAEALYPPGHPYSWLTIGVMEDVEAATRADVEAFFLRYYVPSNASLCVVGSMDEDQALGIVERYFGPIDGGARALRPWTPTERLVENLSITLRDRVELERLYLVWPSVPQFHPDDAALLLLSDIVARGKSSRLYRKLVVELELAQDVSAYQSGRELAGTFGVYVTLRPGCSRGRVRDLIDTEIKAIAESGVDEDELRRVRNGRLAGFLYALENIGGFGGVADRLNAYNIYLGDPGRITTDVQRYQEVTAASIQAVAQQYVIGRPRVALEVVASERPTVSASSAGAAPRLDRSVAPVSLPAARFRSPRPEVRTLRNGVPLWIIPQRDLPIVAATAVLAGGASQLPGVSWRAGQAHRRDALGGDPFPRCPDPGPRGRGNGDQPLDKLRLGRGLCQPSVSDAPLGGQPRSGGRRPVRPGLPRGRVGAATRSDPGRFEGGARQRRGPRLPWIARCPLPAGREPDLEHPYRLPIDGDTSTVERLGRDDLGWFHDRFHGVDQAAWIVAGDLDPDAIAAALDERLTAAGWDTSAREDERPTLPFIERSARPRILLLDRPGASPGRSPGRPYRFAPARSRFPRCPRP